MCRKIRSADNYKIDCPVHRLIFDSRALEKRTTTVRVVRLDPVSAVTARLTLDGRSFNR
jgi:hypothetical protein